MVGLGAPAQAQAGAKTAKAAAERDVLAQALQADEEAAAQLADDRAQVQQRVTALGEKQYGS
jgi:hypothetical protein